MELVEQFMDRRMDLPFVNWYVGEGSQLYEDWSIQGLPTYIVVARDGVIRGRSHEVESLYDVILEATGADGETRAKLGGDEPETRALDRPLQNEVRWTPPLSAHRVTASVAPPAASLAPVWTYVVPSKLWPASAPSGTSLNVIREATTAAPTLAMWPRGMIASGLSFQRKRPMQKGAPSRQAMKGQNGGTQ